MKIRAWVGVLAGAVLLSGCSSAVAGRGAATVGSSPSSSTTPSSSFAAPAGPVFPRLTAETEFGDPPLDDVCATFGTTLFRSSGYYAAIPNGARAASCSFYLNTTPTSTAVRPEAQVDIFLDDENGAGQASQTIGPYGLEVTKPVKPGDACTDDVVTSLLDVDIQAYSVRKTLSDTTLCALSSEAAHRAATIMEKKTIVTRHLASNSLTTQDLCAAADATDSRVALPSNEAALGFQTACRIPDGDYDWWIELRFGIQPSDAESQPVTLGGHVFESDIDPDNGYCRYRWQGPKIPGTTDYEEITVKRIAADPATGDDSCTAVGILASEVITSLGRH